jgi:hypothetical protein
MIDQRMEELMWLEIEGKISTGDREILHRYLESNGEARGYFSDILRMAKLFQQTGEINPPSELRSRILRALEKAAPPKVETPGFAERLGALFSPRPVWRYAAVGAAGIVIGVLGYHLMKNGSGVTEPVDIKQFYGSIAAGGNGLPESTLDIDLPGAKGTITVRRNDKSVLSELSVDSADEVEIVLEYGGSPIEIAAGKLSDHPSNQVAIEDREVHVRNRGKGTYHILFSLHEDPASPVTVRVLSEGSVLFEKEISPSRVPDKG